MFCPKCGSLLLPKKDKSKKVFACSCGYSTKEMEESRLKEQIVVEGKIEVLDPDRDLESLPITDADCPQCKNNKAYFWLVQTRASDEPETKFLKCVACKHTWRDYN